jgi:hypothetical protein
MLNEIHMARHITKICSERLNLLSTIPVSILDCPTDCILLPHRVVVAFKPGTKPYIKKNQIVITLADTVLATINPNLFTSTETTYCLVNIENVNFGLKSKLINQNIMLKNKDCSLMCGNGSLETLIWYSSFST